MSIDYTVYLRTQDNYLASAEKLVARGEYRKASELLWGCSSTSS